MEAHMKDQNGNPVHKSVRREADGTWSAMVWFGSGVVTNVQRRFGYVSRAAARDADISESAEQTNRKFRG
jgi:hypothetical protein